MDPTSLCHRGHEKSVFFSFFAVFDFLKIFWRTYVRETQRTSIPRNSTSPLGGGRSLTESQSLVTLDFMRRRHLPVGPMPTPPPQQGCSKRFCCGARDCRPPPDHKTCARTRTDQLRVRPFLVSACFCECHFVVICGSSPLFAVPLEVPRPRWCLLPAAHVQKGANRRRPPTPSSCYLSLAAEGLRKPAFHLVHHDVSPEPFYALHHKGCATPAVCL